MKQKMTSAEFVQDVQDTLPDFLNDMEQRNFAPRNNTEWFKLLADYLGASDFRKDVVDDIDD